MDTRFVSSAALSLCLVFCGCSDPGSALRKPVFTAGGTVTLFGAPIAGATVAFAPQEGQPTAFGTTDDNGKFSLTTYDFKDGAAAGRFKVVVSKTASVAEQTMTGAGDHEAEANSANSHNAKDAAGGTAVLVPRQYSSASETPLTAEVKSGGENVFTFDLK